MRRLRVAIDVAGQLSGLSGGASGSVTAGKRRRLDPPGDGVVLDDLGSHEGKAVRQAIRKAGAHLIFLPGHSPDLNPIEQVDTGDLQRLPHPAQTPFSASQSW